VSHVFIVLTLGYESSPKSIVQGCEDDTSLSFLAPRD
jgi:hypothetical protein